MLSPRDDDLNRRILGFGREIFSDIGRTQPSAFNRNYWSGRMMEWSMRQPDFKVNLFRLVDVLPSLKSNRAVASHVREYLEEPTRAIHPLLKWGLPSGESVLWNAATSFAVRTSVEQMAAQFIAGSSPQQSLKALHKVRKRRLAFTVDLLGEFSVSEKEALAYVERYEEALDVFGREVPGWRESASIVEGHPGESSPICISVKLSALYSQCSPLNFERSVAVLSERLARIAARALELKALIYVDAEDCSNNPIIYKTFMNVFGSDQFRTYPYAGIVVQAYAKDSEGLCRSLLEFARQRGAPIAVRLVKGAYWDHETIMSRLNNWPSPLFSRKESSDAHYERLSRLLLDHTDLCLPAFGSHNIRSLAHACCYAAEKGIDKRAFELQMLFGMADPIADAFAARGYLVRMYVPLGEMLPGMGYLVRRLLENTSNESFLRHTFHDDAQVDELLREPQPGE